MRFAAIIENDKVKKVVDVALFQLTNTAPVRMVNIERYDVRVGDDYLEGKFWRDSVELPLLPTLAELQEEIARLKAGDGKTYVSKLVVLERLDAAGLREPALAMLKADAWLYEKWLAAQVIDVENEDIRNGLIAIGADLDVILAPVENPGD